MGRWFLSSHKTTFWQLWIFCFFPQPSSNGHCNAPVILGSGLDRSQSTRVSHAKACPDIGRFPKSPWRKSGGKETCGYRRSSRQPMCTRCVLRSTSSYSRSVVLSPRCSAGIFTSSYRGTWRKRDLDQGKHSAFLTQLFSYWALPT